jgi:hypothetical protein
MFKNDLNNITLFVSCGESDFLLFHYKFGIGFRVTFVTCGTDVVVTGIKKKFL